MNPFEFLDALETIQLDKLQLDNKNEYTKEEVIALIKEIGINYRKAIFNGEYIMNIEAVDKSNVTIADEEFSIQKLITEDDKYLLFVQITDVLEDITDSDMSILAEEISKAVSKSSNIAGVVLLPPKMEISLITAKLETLSYGESLNLTDEDNIIIDKIDNIKINNINTIDTTKFTSAYTTGGNNTSTSIYNNYFLM